MSDNQAPVVDTRGVVEVLNRSGQVVQRLPCSSAVIRLGRAYDNDLIVADPYVCPHHLELRPEEGRLAVVDLGSLNGTYTESQKERIEFIELQDGATIHFGHSQLRYHDSGAQVAPTWRDTARHGLLALMGKPWMLVLAGILAIAALLADDLLDSPARPRLLTMAGDLLYPLLGILAWAGFWSLLSRVITHRSNFHVHIAISFIGVAGLFCSAQLMSLIGFAFGWNEIAPWLELTGMAMVASLVIYSHLRYALHGELARQAVVAGLASIILFGTPVIGDLIERNEFSSLPYLEPLLWPPRYRLVDGETIEVFFEQAETLRKQLDEAANEN